MKYMLSEPGAFTADAFKNFAPVPASAPDMRLRPRVALTSVQVEAGLAGGAGALAGAGGVLVVGTGAAFVVVIVGSAAATLAEGVGDEQLTSATVATAASTAPVAVLKACPSLSSAEPGM
jgi:hypothetical protein